MATTRTISDQRIRAFNARRWHQSIVAIADYIHRRRDLGAHRITCLVTDAKSKRTNRERLTKIAEFGATKHVVSAKMPDRFQISKIVLRV